MSPFLLELLFQDEDSHSICDSKWLEAMTDTEENELIVLEVEDISLYVLQELTSSSSRNKIPQSGAIFVPPSLIDAWLREQNLLVEQIDDSSSCCLLKYVSSGIQTKLLSKIHHRIGQEKYMIRSLVRSRGTNCRPRTSDILLFDASDCQEGWLDIMDEICGQPMSGFSSFVIKCILTSVSTVSSPKQMNNNILKAVKNKILSLEPCCEIPTCGVCLHRIYPPRLGMPKPRNDQLCSEYCSNNYDMDDISNGTSKASVFTKASTGLCNEPFLRPWPFPSQCKACHLIKNYWSATNDARRKELDDVFCYCCALQETLWICLICGFVGCGRYSQAHAAEHFQETNHAFSLEMATLRTWDYTTGEFAHRGDLLECPSVRCYHPRLVNVALPWEDGESNNFESTTSIRSQGKTPKKASVVGEEYEALIQSALEDQAQHYEGEISHIRAMLTAKHVVVNNASNNETHEIQNLKSDIKNLQNQVEVTQRNLLEIQIQEAGHRAASQKLLKQQKIAEGVLEKIRTDIDKEEELRKLQIEDLEQQVLDLTANLRMKEKIAKNEELNNAQIYGSTSAQIKTKRNGKKIRRNGSR